ncbi:MAG TPA: GNAT family N-acetyltransferase [Sphingobium sp.]
MTPVLWRRATPADAAALSALGGATFLTSFAHDHPGQALLAHIAKAHSLPYYQDALADPEQIVIIGETALGAPVGYTLLTPADLPVAPEPGDLEIKRIYLLAPWQSGGHGSTLMDEIYAVARERRATRLLLAVYEKNEHAQRFYARQGFSQIGRTTFMVGDTPFEDLVYARRM